MAPPWVTIGTRLLQLLFTAVVLGLSIKAVRWQRFHTAPATNSYSAFAGAFGLLTGLIGLLAIWISAIPSLIMSAMDGLASLLLLAGGIAFAVQLRHVDCSNSKARTWTAACPLINGGCVPDPHEKGYKTCGFTGGSPNKNSAELASRCRSAEADATFLFLGFIACLAAAVLAMMAHRRGSIMKRSAV